jgi:hypothetical protein
LAPVADRLAGLLTLTTMTASDASSVLCGCLSFVPAGWFDWQQRASLAYPLQRVHCRLTMHLKPVRLLALQAAQSVVGLPPDGASAGNKQRGDGRLREKGITQQRKGQ